MIDWQPWKATSSLRTTDAKRESRNTASAPAPSPLFRTQLGACSPAFGDTGTSTVGRGGLSGAPRLFLRGSALPNFFCLILPSCRLGWGKPPPHVHGPAVSASQVVFSSTMGLDFSSPKDKLSKLPALELLPG